MRLNVILFGFLILLLGGCGQQVDGGLQFATADPGLNIVFAIPGMQAAPVPDIDGPIGEPIVLPEAIDAEEEGQQDCDIKLNIAANGEKIFHVPSGAYWSRVKIDLERGEGYACSEEEAIEQGYRKSSR